MKKEKKVYYSTINQKKAGIAVISKSKIESEKHK